MPPTAQGGPAQPAGEVTAAPAEGELGAAGVWRVVLRHPGRLNAMSRAMWRQLRAVFDDLQQRVEVRCVIVQGEGAAFCAGGDISEYPQFRFDAAQLRDFHEVDVWGGLAAMLACDVPLIARIDGACMGAGVEIAACCDLRIATPQARFGAPIAKLGFPMAPREAQLVAAAAGEMTARQMLLEAATFSAEDMAQRGFLSRVVAPDALDADVTATALRIAALAPQAARLNKQTLRSILMPDVQPYVELDSRSNRPLALDSQALVAMNNIANAAAAEPADPYAYADSAEHREGVTAFLAKRPPKF